MSQSALVMIDGEPVAPEAARVSVFDRGFLYGDSVFEALRSYGGKLFALDEHMARLAQSAELTRIRLPLGPSEFAREVERAVELAGFEESYARVMVTRGRGDKLGLATSSSLSPAEGHPGAAARAASAREVRNWHRRQRRFALSACPMAPRLPAPSSATTWCRCSPSKQLVRSAPRRRSWSTTKAACSRARPPTCSW
ncbi:MAG: aminotransferase class IV [Polyangiaceae bacterium]